MITKNIDPIITGKSKTNFQWPMTNDRPKSVRNRCVIEVFGGVCVLSSNDRPKSVRNRCVIEVFGGVCVLSFGFRIFCWYRGFCHRTGSDLLLFLSMIQCLRYLTIYLCEYMYVMYVSYGIPVALISLISVFFHSFSSTHLFIEVTLIASYGRYILSPKRNDTK